MSVQTREQLDALICFDFEKLLHVNYKPSMSNFSSQFIAVLKFILKTSKFTVIRYLKLCNTFRSSKSYRAILE